MKKFLAIPLVCAFAFSFVACGGSDESSAPAFSNANSTPKEEPSKVTSSSAAPQSSSAAESSDTVVEDNNLITQFISWGKPYYQNIVSTISTEATSLQLNKYNEAVAAEENGVFTAGNKLELAEGADIANFAIAVFEYNHTVFGYVKKELQAVGSAKLETAVPEDGFVVVIDKKNDNKIKQIQEATATTLFFPHGIIVNTGLDAEIEKAATAPTIDGKVEDGEYGDVVWTANPESPLFSYAQFEVNNYNVNADVYMTYDENYLYLAAVVDTPDHFNDRTPDTCGDMYDLTCIQVSVMGVAPSDEYITNGAWDYRQTNRDIVDKHNLIRQWGLGVNPDTAESLKCVWMAPAGAADNSTTVNTRVDQITTYEVQIPWADLGNAENLIDIKEGTELGIAVSINSGSADKPFQVLHMRDGGGIIGINDLTKIPTITLS